MKRYLWVFALGSLCSLFVVAGCGEDDAITDPEETGSVEVLVTEGDTETPISKVVVTLAPGGKSSVTDEIGKAVIEGISTGEYMVEVMKPRYTSGSEAVQVVGGQKATATIQIMQDSLWDVLNFNGRYISIPDANTLDLSGGSYTLEAYVYADSLAAGSWNWVIGHGTSNAELDYLFGFDKKRLTLFARSTDVVLKSVDPMNVKQWYHIAAVQDVVAGKVFLYVDGVQIAEGMIDGVGVSTIGNLLIGARESFGSGQGDELFRGRITEVRIWNIARSSNEINSTKNSTLSGKEEGLVGYWPLDEAKGSSIIDHSSNKLDGVVVGVPAWEQVLSPWN